MAGKVKLFPYKNTKKEWILKPQFLYGDEEIPNTKQTLQNVVTKIDSIIKFCHSNTPEYRKQVKLSKFPNTFP